MKNFWLMSFFALDGRSYRPDVLRENDISMFSKYLHKRRDRLERFSEEIEVVDEQTRQENQQN